MRFHEVTYGENLASIARDYYGIGDTRHALFIWQHNRDIIPNPNQVFAGQRILIPYHPGELRRLTRA